jgi:aminoglycoside phosphotransferase (APT) family kinase protein
VATYDGQTRQALAVLDRPADRGAALATWEAAMAATWRGRDGWVHGDVAAGNLLLVAGALSAVIDFGCSAVGDPACDLTVAWTLLDGTGRDAFRAAVGLDEGTWARARGWGLWKALVTIERSTSGDAADLARRTVRRVLAEHAARGR